MAVKLEQKNELLKNFNALKALYNLEFVEEQSLENDRNRSIAKLVLFRGS
jgi:hypothetical protein